MASDEDLRKVVDVAIGREVVFHSGGGGLNQGLLAVLQDKVKPVTDVYLDCRHYRPTLFGDAVDYHTLGSGQGEMLVKHITAVIRAKKGRRVDPLGGCQNLIIALSRAGDTEVVDVKIVAVGVF